MSEAFVAQMEALKAENAKLQDILNRVGACRGGRTGAGAVGGATAGEPCGGVGGCSRGALGRTRRPQARGPTPLAARQAPAPLPRTR